MTAKQISEMILRVTRRKISARSIITSSIAAGCRGIVGDIDRIKYFDSDEVELILRYYEFNPAAFVGKG